MKFNLLNNLRLLTRNRQEPFLSFKRILGFFPRDIELYKLAVRHRSMPLQDKDGKRVNNERLEFLGDAVLNTVVADVLYRRYPKEEEGFLTNARSNIVKRGSLNNICHLIGLDKLVVTDQQICNKNSVSIYGNALEALIGAVYLDIGYEKCADFIKKCVLISPEWLNSLVSENDNYKSELFEWCQQHYYSLDFELIEEIVTDGNNHTFTSQVLINNKPVCIGTGASKKESHQQASLHALELIRDDKLEVSVI